MRAGEEREKKKERFKNRLKNVSLMLKPLNPKISRKTKYRSNIHTIEPVP